jgi:hypothetical protein
MSRFLREEPHHAPREQQQRSVYDERFTESAPGLVFANGRFVETGSCCDDPLRCERPECWRPLSEWGR